MVVCGGGGVRSDLANFIIDLEDEDCPESAVHVAAYQGQVEELEALLSKSQLALSRARRDLRTSVGAPSLGPALFPQEFSALLTVADAPADEATDGRNSPQSERARLTRVHARRSPDGRRVSQRLRYSCWFERSRVQA